MSWRDLIGPGPALPERGRDAGPLPPKAYPQYSHNPHNSGAGIGAGHPLNRSPQSPQSPQSRKRGWKVSFGDIGDQKPALPPSPAPPPVPPCEAWEERAAILEFDGGLSRTDAEEQATARRWLLHLPDGWRDITTTPPASRAEIQAWHPDALAIRPADDDADPWGDPEGEPGHPEEQDPGAAFYAALFSGMDAPRAYVTLTPEDTHRAVVSGLVRPEEARGAVLLALKTPQGHALMSIPAARWDGLAFLEKITLH